MKRSIWKTMLTVFLLSGLAAGICAGCGETATPTTTTIVQTSSANLNPPGTLPVCKEVETIRVVITEHPQFIQSYEYGENKFTTWLQDRTNVAVDFILFPETDTREKLTAELSSGGDLGDLILIQMDRAMLFTYGRSGALTPLNDLIERYGFAM